VGGFWGEDREGIVVEDVVDDIFFVLVFSGL
jgi:hypothetical protein